MTAVLFDLSIRLGRDQLRVIASENETKKELLDRLYLDDLVKTHLQVFLEHKIVEQLYLTQNQKLIAPNAGRLPSALPIKIQAFVEGVRVDNDRQSSLDSKGQAVSSLSNTKSSAGKSIQKERKESKNSWVQQSESKYQGTRTKSHYRSPSPNIRKDSGYQSSGKQSTSILKAYQSIMVLSKNQQLRKLAQSTMVLQDQCLSKRDRKSDTKSREQSISSSRVESNDNAKLALVNTGSTTQSKRRQIPPLLGLQSTLRQSGQTQSGISSAGVKRIPSSKNEFNTPYSGSKRQRRFNYFRPYD